MPERQVPASDGTRNHTFGFRIAVPGALLIQRAARYDSNMLDTNAFGSVKAACPRGRVPGSLFPCYGRFVIAVECGGSGRGAGADG